MSNKADAWAVGVCLFVLVGSGLWQYWQTASVRLGGSGDRVLASPDQIQVPQSEQWMW